MDLEIAQAVIGRWSQGLPVSENMLYKSAEALGEDPELALVEARYYTTLDSYLSRGGPMTTYEKVALSLACGQYPDSFEKTASKYNLSEEELIISTLASNEFIPYLYKLAEAAPGVPQDDSAVQQNPAARDPAAIQQQTGNPAALTSQDWKGDTLYRPTPTAPGQLPPGGEGGNMNQLMEQEQNKDQIQGQKDEQQRQQMMAQTQQQPQQGSKEEIQQIYNQMTPEEKAPHAVPEANPQELPEIAQHIQAIEQQVGTPITDPAQIKKIYGEMQKAKKKEIDEAIKMQFQNQADASSAGQFGPLPARLGGGASGGAPGGSPGGDPNSGGQPPQTPPSPNGGPPGAMGGDFGSQPKPKGKTTLTKTADWKNRLAGAAVGGLGGAAGGTLVGAATNATNPYNIVLGQESGKDSSAGIRGYGRGINYGAVGGGITGGLVGALAGGVRGAKIPDKIISRFHPRVNPRWTPGSKQPRVIDEIVGDFIPGRSNHGENIMDGLMGGSIGGGITGMAAASTTPSLKKKKEKTASINPLISEALARMFNS